MIEQQTSLLHEADNLERFAKNFEATSSVAFPKPIRPFVNANVLVETYEEGLKLNEARLTTQLILS
jgi:predicted unusual protein kinase regulating ubiquinone biosynthesis (AarF/ABC1/UbiB family)